MNKSESIASLVLATIAVMQEVKSIDKSMTIGTGTNAYKGIADKDVKRIIGESMAKNGLAIFPIGIEENVQIDRWEQTGQYGSSMKQQVFSRVKTTYLLTHTSGEFIEIQGSGHGIDSQDKSAGKATTYALKYALLYTFLTPTGAIDDTDKDHSDDKPVPPKNKPITPVPTIPAPPKTPAPVNPKLEPVKLIHNSDKYKSAITAMTEGIKGKIYSMVELKSMYQIDSVTEELLSADVDKIISKCDATESDTF